MNAVDDRRQHERDGERRLAADHVGDPREGVDAEERAGVLKQRGDPGPERQLAGDLLGREPLALEVLAEDDVDQVEAEEADPPEADDAREGQDHADDRVPPPARVAEELGERAELVASLEPRLGSSSSPSLPRPPSSARAP